MSYGEEFTVFDTHTDRLADGWLRLEMELGGMGDSSVSLRLCILLWRLSLVYWNDSGLNQSVHTDQQPLLWIICHPLLSIIMGGI